MSIESSTSRGVIRDRLQKLRQVTERAPALVALVVCDQLWRSGVPIPSNWVASLWAKVNPQLRLNPEDGTIHTLPKTGSVDDSQRWQFHPGELVEHNGNTRIVPPQYVDTRSNPQDPLRVEFGGRVWQGDEQNELPSLAVYCLLQSLLLRRIESQTNDIAPPPIAPRST